MKIFEIANVRNPRGNGCPVIKHVITRVNPEKTREKKVGIFPTFLVTSWGRGPICVVADLRRYPGYYSTLRP